MLLEVTAVPPPRPPRELSRSEKSSVKHQLQAISEDITGQILLHRAAVMAFVLALDGDGR